MLVLHYICTITLSAFLLFLVQPLFAKTILPHMGGSPSVWVTSMLFFQSVLLLGYLYAHLSPKLFGLKRSSIIHAILLLGSLLLLPVVLIKNATFDPVFYPVPWLLTTLGLSVGLLFFALSANSPLLQLWFSKSGHVNANNPYFLYSASNVGSFSALFAYPLLVEPFFTLNEQMQYWSWGYGAFVILLLIAIIHIIRAGHITLSSTSKATQETHSEHTAGSLKKQFGYWVILAAVPSSLMLGVTQYVTTDLAAVPLLWVIPLALYLLSFVLVFSRYGFIYRLCRKMHLALLSTALILFTIGGSGETLLVASHIIVFFVACMVLHGQLASHKPSTQYLTLFYFAMSLGGVMGSIFNVIIAPIIFTDIWEYPLALLAALAVYEGRKWDMRNTIKHIIPAIILLGLLWLFRALYNLYLPTLEATEWWNKNVEETVFVIVITITGTLLYAFRKVRLRLFASVVGIWILLLFAKPVEVLFKDRNFFGVSRVTYDAKLNVHKYKHGTTLHGIQSQNEAFRLNPVSYYSSIIELLNAVPENIKQAPMAITGLGVGTLACYAQEGQDVDLYEIDPLVEKIARDTSLFTYMRDCPGNKNVKLGDARILLGKEENNRYGVIIKDAYSSDSLPVHLMTIEAVEEYLSKLRKDGILVFHVSNRHLDLFPIFANIGNAIGIEAIGKRFAVGNLNKAEGKREEQLIFPSFWVVLTNNDALRNTLKQDYNWQILQTNTNPPWSDNYSNLLEAIIAKYK